MARVRVRVSVGGQCAMDLLTCKVVVLVLLVLVRLTAGVSPLVVCASYHTNRSHLVDVVVAICLSLAGGVLLATAMIHLVPQVRGALHHFLPDHTFPVTELLIVAGFFVTFFLDETFIGCRSTSKVHPEKDELPETSSVSISPDLQPNHPHHTLRATLLGLHSFAKGAAVGLADSLGDLIFLSVATAVHESVAVVGFTLHLMKSEEDLGLIVFWCIFLALVMFVGMIVGTLLSFYGVDGTVVAVIRGLAAGNVLYVTFYEMLTREVRARAMGLLSHFLALMGFLVMLGLQIIGGFESKYSVSERSSLCSSTEEAEEETSYAEEN